MARKMKDSGIEWIGEIPEGWETQKLKYYATVTSGEILSKNEYDFSGDIPVIGSNGKIGTTYKSNNHSEVITTGRVGTIGTAQIVQDAWITDNALIIKSHSISRPFLTYVIPNFDFKFMLSGTAQPLITATKLKNQYIPVPSSEVQDKIVQYLNTQIFNLSHLISQICSSIELYKKLKQAVITQAVTKGVRGEREMKDSGVEWIGEIPKEWDILNLVAHTSMLTPMRDRPENLDGPIPWIRIEDFDGKYISSSKASLGVSKETVQSMNLKIYPVGTILCTSSCIMGKCAIVSRELVSNQRFIGIIPDQNTCENFLYYLMLSNSERMNYLATGALQANLSRSSFEHLKVQFPSYQEQKEIADYLDAKCAEIDGLIAKKEQLVKELESYKKSLIYEVVTGKREV